MADTVVRDAADLLDGDEIMLGEFSLTKNSWGLVQEKTRDEDGNVVLVVVVEPETPVRTAVRPREQTQPSTPFGGIDMGDDPDGDIRGYDGA